MTHTNHHALSRGACATDLFPVAASSSLDAADAASPPEWVHLIPAGTFSGRDGRGPYRLDAEAVLAAYARHGADLPIDYEHQSLEAADKRGPVPAAGWIRELAAREDGIWGRVEWTPSATALLAERAYRYLSPVFRHDRSGRVVALEGAGLTHTPNLYLRAAARQEDPMDLTPLAEALGIDPSADIETIAAHAKQLREAATREPDPAQYVPVAMHKQVSDQLAALQAEIARRDAEAAVAEAMAARKISPGLRDWALAYAARDLDGFRAFAAAAPEIVPSGETKPAAHAVAGVTLADEDRIAARLLGMTEEAFAQAKKTQNLSTEH
jgi:phage I-like protein